MNRIYLFITSASFFFILSFANKGQTQLGININLYQSEYNEWTEVLEKAGVKSDILFLYKYGFSTGIDYGFKLKDYRIEFFPQFAYMISDYKYFKNGSNAMDIDFDLEQYQFKLKTKIYPLDFLSRKGMQCPSFYHGGEIFTKGWFIMVQPELSFSSKKLEGSIGTDEIPIIFEDGKMIFAFGFGTGLDIGLGEYFSLSPEILYSILIGEKWPGLSAVFNQPDYNDATSASYISAGLRFGFWF